MIDVIARGMIEESNGDISQISEKVNNHTEDSDIHVTATDKKNWNSHPNDVLASGNPVVIDNLQGGVPFSEITVSGKNLIPYPYYHGTNHTVNGITFTVNDDGTITANGTSSGVAIFRVSHQILISRGKYTISGCPNGGGNTTYKMGVYTSGASETNIVNEYGSGAAFEIEESQKIEVWCVIFAGQTVDNLVFRPQLELGSTPTAYEQPITGRDLTVNVNGNDITITPDSNPYTIPNDIRQQDGLNNISVSNGKISVTGVRKNAALKKIWDEIGEIKTAIIVSNGETTE